MKLIKIPKINIEPYQERLMAQLRRLQDVRVIGQGAFVVIVLLISWSGAKAIQTNYVLQQQISGLSQQNDLKKLQNTNARLSNDYYKSNQYLELAARQNFGLGAPGEKEIVVPKRVALAKTVNPPKDLTNEAIITAPKRSNFEAWTDFFLHRQVAR